MVPDLARVVEGVDGVLFPGPGLLEKDARLILGIAGGLVVAFVPLGWSAIGPMLVFMVVFGIGVAAEGWESRGWRLEGAELVRTLWGVRRPVEQLVVRGGPGELLTVAADDQVICECGPGNGGLERVAEVASRWAASAGIPCVDERPMELWELWGAGRVGLAVLRCRYLRANEQFGLVPPAREPPEVVWEHDRCVGSIRGMPFELIGDQVRIGNFWFDVAAFRHAAVIQGREAGRVRAWIAFVVDSEVHETPAFAGGLPVDAARIRWLLERIQERIRERGSEREVPEAMRRMRQRE